MRIWRERRDTRGVPDGLGAAMGKEARVRCLVGPAGKAVQAIVRQLLVSTVELPVEGDVIGEHVSNERV